MATPEVDQAPMGITFPAINTPFELKPVLIQLLPKFYGQPGEDPNKHLRAFHLACSSQKAQGMTEDDMKLHAFPFTLADKAKDWLFNLYPGSVTNWTSMKKTFLERFFPASRAANIRKEISGIRQYDGESLHEYWERFKQLCASCPQHGITEQQLIQNFYEGLLGVERNMVDAASGGAFMNNTLEGSKRLIINMAENAHQFGTRRDNVRKVNEVNVSATDHRIDALTALVEKMLVGQQPGYQNQAPTQPQVCGICAILGHSTDACPTLQESYADVNAIGGFPGPPQRKYDPYSNTYNPEWKDHPNFSYGNRN
jgi:hypothetical protein